MVVRIGVVGTGVMGADHIKTIASAVAGAGVTAASDLDANRARIAVAGLAGVRIHDDPIALVKDPEVDAVIVASADPTHEELVLACLEAGKAVLCEKPLTPTTDASLRIVAAEVALGKKLVSVGFMRRYDPGYAELRAALRASEIGEPLMLHCIHRNATSAPNTPSSALITGSAVHEIDIVRWLFGEEIVRGTVHKPRRSTKVVGAQQDPIVVVLETESGVLVDVEVFVNCQYGYDVRCELVGETGSIALDGPAHTFRRTERKGEVGISADWRDRFAEAYRRELQDWVDGVALDEQRGASAWDGYVSTAVANACVDALETGASSTVGLAPRPDIY